MLRTSPKELYEAARLVSEAALAPGGAGAGAGRHQPDLLAARPADLPLRHRRVRDAVLRVHHRRVLPRRQPAAGGGGRAWPSCRASPRTSRTTSSTSSPSGSARRSTPTASRTRCELPYAVFEDQRSGETLGRLQKVRTDVERLIPVSINVLFTSLVGIIFVVIYAFSVHWVIAPVYFLTVPLLGVLSSVLSRKIKTIQKVIVAETTALAGSTTESLRNIELVKSLGLAQQEIARLNATTDKILQARAEEGALHPQPELHPGHHGQRAAHQHPVPDALPDLHAGDHGRPVLLALHLLVLHLRPAAGARQHHQRLPRDRGVAEELRRHPGDAGRAAAGAPGAAARPRAPRLRRRQLQAPVGHDAGAHRHLVRGASAATPWRSSGRPARARRRWSSCWSASIRRRRATSSTTATAPRRSISTSCASASASSPRTRSSSRAPSARTCCS